MKYAKHLKILFLIAGMLLSAKPIIGFGVVSHAKDAAELDYNLLQHLFSKRKQDYLDDDLCHVIAIQRGLKDADLTFVWEICRMIFGIIVPLLILAKATKHYLRELFLNLDPQRDLYLSTGKLSI